MPTVITETRRRTQSGGGQSTVSALKKGLDILGLFDAETPEWTLDGIADAADLPRMTAYRMIRTLQSARYIVRDPMTNRYRLGPAVLATTYINDAHAGLTAIALPYLRQLAETTGEAAVLAVEIDGVAIKAAAVQTPRPLKGKVAIGRVITDVASAQGKIFAAFGHPTARAEALAQPQPQLTPNTITDPVRLARELEQVARDGLAFDLQERNLGTCGVAAPVYDQLGTVIGALSVVVPPGRFGPEERRNCAEAVRTTAMALSAYHGYVYRAPA
jgi:IclR family transcriptional regulator, acetate operon repressor